jgi:indole-3-glycerol phosphate synthase
VSTILDRILADKKNAVEAAKVRVPLDALKGRASQVSAPSFLKAVSVPGQTSVIAEMKKASPSAGVLSEDYRPRELARFYAESGARALSVLTEEKSFLGQVEHLREAREGAPGLPVLRKDFIFDPYQVYEARAWGASAVLLIAAALDASAMSELMKLARDLGLDVLVEVHDERELEAVLPLNPALVGINNRNLKDLSISVETTFRLLPRIPSGVPVVSESGIRDEETVRRLRKAGVRATLIGESILKGGTPANIAKILGAFVRAGRE